MINRYASSPEYSFATSMASSIVTVAGISFWNMSEYAPRRRSTMATVRRRAKICVLQCIEARPLVPFDEATDISACAVPRTPYRLVVGCDGLLQMAL